MFWQLTITLSLPLLVAISFIILPALLNPPIVSTIKFIPWICIAFIAISLLCYTIWGDAKRLKDWRKKGQKHYQLMVQTQQLGGIDGIVARMKSHLANHPDDTKGWQLLGKLYESMGEKAKAEYALSQSIQ